MTDILNFFTEGADIVNKILQNKNPVTLGTINIIEIKDKESIKKHLE